MAINPLPRITLVKNHPIATSHNGKRHGVLILHFFYKMGFRQNSAAGIHITDLDVASLVRRTINCRGFSPSVPNTTINELFIAEVLSKYASSDTTAGRYMPNDGDPRSVLSNLTNIAELVKNLLTGANMAIGTYEMVKRGAILATPGVIEMIKISAEHKTLQLKLLEDWLYYNSEFVLKALRVEGPGIGIPSAISSKPTK